MGQGSLGDSFAVSDEERATASRAAAKPKGDATFSRCSVARPKTLQLRESVVVDLFGNRTRVRRSITEPGVESAAFSARGRRGIDLRRGAALASHSQVNANRATLFRHRTRRAEQRRCLDGGRVANRRAPEALEAQKRPRIRRFGGLYRSGVVAMTLF
jgi:hypothetical protein